MSQMRNQTE